MGKFTSTVSPSFHSHLHFPISEGGLVTDFWAAYDSIANGKRQFCLVDLLREFEKVDVSNSSAEWPTFSKKTKRLFKDA